MSDRLSFEEIQQQLGNELQQKLNINVVESVESTNDRVKELARNGEKEGYILISHHQTKGKGRLGRSFFSPEGTGIYMSLLLKPMCTPEQSTLITTAAAVAVCIALEKLGVKKPLIKWVNDVYVDGKKVCGILTEAGFGMSQDKLDYAVLGVGINIYCPENDFPEEIKDIAGAVFKEQIQGLCNRFVSEFLVAFFDFYRNLTQCRHIPLYREKCFVLGQEINVIQGEKTTPARALDIDENCNLLVQFFDGKTQVLDTGEISVRILGQLKQ